MSKLAPFFVEKPWGGSFISQHYRLPPKKFGEAWLLSTLPDGESTQGTQKLSEYLGHALPYLIKVIDAQEPLSIQVHPDDKWALELEESRGKTECWLILDARPGAGVYLGLRPGVTEAQLRASLETNSRVDELMEFYPVRRGDFVTVEAGTIHAIGAGVTLLEVQQASGITYRIWDWGRTDRELHIEKGLRVANFQARPGILSNVMDDPAPKTLLTHADFSCSFNQSNGAGWFVDLETLAVSSGSTPQALKSFIFVN